MIQGNGRQEMKTLNSNVNRLSDYPSESEWLNFEGGRNTSFSTGWDILNSAGYNDPYMGSYYFAIPATTFAAGECLVFTPRRAAEYDGLSTYRPGPYNLNANELSCEVAPDPGRAYYVSASDIGGGINSLPTQFWYETTKAWSTGGRSGVENQADDTRVILKRVVDAPPKITFEDFDKLPQVTVLSASLQYGGGRESRLEWSSNEKMPIELLNKARPRPTVIPNVRTREGIRMRWFKEPPSNRLNSGPLSDTPYLEESLLGNWNPRAAFIVRSPWENVGGTLPKSGPGGGPWFFGAYTRDLFDPEVSWDKQMPVPRDGRYHGNPFGPPQEGNDRNILFDVPRAPTGVVSIGQFQHAKLSDLVWHPSYAVGNSLADPRLGRGGYSGLELSAARASTRASAAMGGFNPSEIGWSTDSQRSAGRDDWAATARDLLGGVPTADNLIYDLSFELNRTLWDRYFLSTGSPAEKAGFLEDPSAHPLPNARLQPAAATRSTATSESLADFHQAAYHLMLDGAFNVNSTRVEAWKAMLGATRKAGYGSDGNVPFPRVLAPPGGPWKAGDDTNSDAAWAGYRELTIEEIDKLATHIVAEVKRRGPFVSLADFVNRRLAGDETGRMGALQAAIESAGLNSDFTNDFPLDNSESLPNYRHPDNLPDNPGTSVGASSFPHSAGFLPMKFNLTTTVLAFAACLSALSAQSRQVRFLAIGDSPPFLQEIRDNVRREVEPEAGSIPPREIIVNKTVVPLSLNRLSIAVEIPAGKGMLDLKEKSADDKAEPWVSIQRPDTGDFLVLLWRGAKAVTWEKPRAFAIADDATSAPASSARIINLAPGNVSTVLGTEKLNLEPGKLLTRVISADASLPFQVYLPDAAGKLKRINSTELTCEAGQRTLAVIYRADGESPRRPIEVVVRREPVTALPAPIPEAHPSDGR